ncbi:MAG: hypothetical protein OEQ18_08850 [Gammaproteobacteria bacterium]|nr:hypothetical protein [Gammaproteobacteria bacterium]
MQVFRYPGFQISLPQGWRKPGLLRRLVFMGNPELYGADGRSIKFAIGPISPAPSAEQQRGNLEAIALRHGHDVIETGTINVGGRDHATMVCRVPGVGVLKNYSLIFGGTEYFVTAQGDPNDLDSIIRTFRVD